MSSIWAVCADNPKYEVSNKGDVRMRSHTTIYSDGNGECEIQSEPELIPQHTTSGYKYVTLDGKRWLVHVLVAKAFIDNPNKLSKIRHLSSDITDNSVDNLEWYNPADNLPSSQEIKGIKVKCVDDGREFNSMMSCAAYYGIDYDKLYYNILVGNSTNGMQIVKVR